MTQAQQKTLSVSAISHGTVIDHIPAGQAMRILKLFHFAQNHQMTLGLNLPSGSMGRKDLIKIENVQIDHADAAKIAIFAPEASVNIIGDFQVQDKFQVTVPESVEGVVPCPNSNCISNHEPVLAKFMVRVRPETIVLHCQYCERGFEQAALLEA